MNYVNMMTDRLSCNRSPASLSSLKFPIWISPLRPAGPRLPQTHWYVLKTSSCSHIYSGIQVLIDRVGLRLHLCADSLAAVTEFAKDLASSFKPPLSEEDLYARFYHTSFLCTDGSTSIPQPKPEPAVVSSATSHVGLMGTRTAQRRERKQVTLFSFGG